jgi:hypothetical protein
MALTLAEAVEKMEELGKELAVWHEVEGFLKGFVKQEEQDSVKKVITTRKWESGGLPPVSLVVPQDVIKAILHRLQGSEIKPREEEIAKLKGMTVKEEETTDGRETIEDKRDGEEVHGEKPREQEGVLKGPAKPGRAKLRVAQEGPTPGKTTRRIVPKPAGAGPV